MLKTLITSTVLAVDASDEAITITARSLMGVTRVYKIVTEDGKLKALEEKATKNEG